MKKTLGSTLKDLVALARDAGLEVRVELLPCRLPPAALVRGAPLLPPKAPKALPEKKPRAKATAPKLTKSKKSKEPKPKKVSIASVSREVLKMIRKPMKVKDLLQELTSRGFKIGGKRPYVTLTSILKKTEGIKQTGPGTFAAGKS